MSSDGKKSRNGRSRMLDARARARRAVGRASDIGRDRHELLIFLGAEYGHLPIDHLLGIGGSGSIRAVF